MPKLKDLFKKQKPEEQSDKIGNEFTRGERDNTMPVTIEVGLGNKAVTEKTKEYTFDQLVSFMGEEYFHGEPLSSDEVRVAIVERLENVKQLVSFIKDKIVNTDEFIAEQAAEMIRYLNEDKDISEVIQFAFDKSPTSGATQTAAFQIRRVGSKKVQLKLLASAQTHTSRVVREGVESTIEKLSRSDKSKLDKLVSGK